MSPDAVAPRAAGPVGQFVPPVAWWRAGAHLLAYTMPASAIGGYLIGGWGTFLTVVLAYVLVPAADQLLGPRIAPIVPRAQASAFRYVLWLSVPIQLALVAFGVWVIAFAEPSIVETVGLTLSVGICSGAVGLTCAHELVHRRSRFERGLGLVLLALATNMPFRVEHVHGHHRNVGTPEDPATARLGESVYRFFVRSFIGQHAHALKIESQRLRRRGHARFGLRNRIVVYAAIELAISLSLWIGFGWPTLAFFLGQSLVACFLLEAVNYVEHYGLRREERGPGRYEPVGPQHSWNANHRVTNWYLFNLGRHSHHHTKEALDYELLGDDPDNPQLPAGYGASILLTMVPPLWRKIMDGRAARVVVKASRR